MTLIWITGVLMLSSQYGGWYPGPAFLLKLTVAVLLFAGVVAINVLLSRTRKTGVPSPLVPKLGMLTTLMTVLAVVLAVFAFNG